MMNLQECPGHNIAVLMEKVGFDHPEGGSENGANFDCHFEGLIGDHFQRLLHLWTYLIK